MSAEKHSDDVVETGVYYDHGFDYGGHATGHGRVVGVLPIRYTDCARYGCKRRVVIDPEDRKQVDGLAEEFRRIVIARDDAGDPPDSTRALQAALRDLADPKPPKPEESTGLGAVVVDREGEKWIRHNGTIAPWHRAEGDIDNNRPWRYFRDIDAVEMLSQGVTP